MEPMELEDAYDRFARAIYGHALALTGHRADAEDALQNVFVKLARRGGSLASIADLEAYLHVAVRREALRLVNRRPRLSAESEFTLLAARNGLPAEEVVRVNLALRDLPAEQREVVILHLYDGLTFRRIGEILEIPADTAASRYRYAREKLKESLGGD